MTIINRKFRDLLEDKEIWREKAPRGKKVRYLKHVNLPLIPKETVFSCDQRPFNWKYFIGEFKWFLSMSTKVEDIIPYSKFWAGVANDGIVNSNYGERLLSGVPSQMYWAYKKLVEDKDTRQAIAFVSGTQFQYEGNKDFPCTAYLNFSIDENQLNMVVRMRSNDLFFGTTYDAPWFGLLHQNMHLLLKETYPDLLIGTYVHSADDFHYYERHFDIISDIKRYESYWIELQKPFFRFEGEKTVITPEAEEFMEAIDFSMSQTEHVRQFEKIVKVSRIS